MANDKGILLGDSPTQQPGAQDAAPLRTVSADIVMVPESRPEPNIVCTRDPAALARYGGAPPAHVVIGGHGKFELPAPTEQQKGFYHPEADMIRATFGDIFKSPADKG